MSNFQPWQSRTAAFLAFGLSVSAMAPLVASAPSFAQASQFSDVSSSYWASNFIQSFHPFILFLLQNYDTNQLIPSFQIRAHLLSTYAVIEGERSPGDTRVSARPYVRPKN